MRSLYESILSDRSKTIKDIKRQVSRDLIIEWLENHNLHERYYDYKLEDDNTVTLIKNKTNIFLLGEKEIPYYIKFNDTDQFIGIYNTNVGMSIDYPIDLSNLPSRVGGLHICSKDIVSNLDINIITKKGYNSYYDDFLILGTTRSDNSTITFKNSKIRIIDDRHDLYKISDNKTIHYNTIYVESYVKGDISVTGDIGYISIGGRIDMFKDIDKRLLKNEEKKISSRGEDGFPIKDQKLADKIMREYFGFLDKNTLHNSVFKNITRPEFATIIYYMNNQWFYKLYKQD